jgi:hypothetical protein
MERYGFPLVSEEMISDVLSRPWIDRYRAGRGKDPVVIVGPCATEAMNI